MTESPLAPSWLSYPSDTSYLNPVLYSNGTTRQVSGEVTIGTVPVSELAATYGTPLLVVDEDDFRARARGFVEGFNRAFDSLCGGVDVYYASKSLLTVQVARWVAEEGLNMDVASGGELAIALRAGFDPAKIGLHGNNKSDQELTRALQTGVGRIVVDSLSEIRRLAALAESAGVSAPVMLRLTTGVHASTHSYIATAHEDQKFGLSMIPAPGEKRSVAEQAVLAVAEHPHLRYLGLHSHIGSQIFEADGFTAAADRMLNFIAALQTQHGITTAELDLGGGYGIAYTEADRPRAPEDIADSLAEGIRATLQSLTIDCPRISIEPGRAISGPAGSTLYRVGTTKTVWVDDPTGADQPVPRRYVAVDGGMSDNPRPVLYDADYSATLASRVSQADPVLTRIVGKHCESGDIVVRDTYQPEDLDDQDLVLVPATGAYCHVMSSNYNALLRPAVVAISGGSARLIIRRETDQDLFAREV